jgi:glycosyltransferase involved in cell wall biosynthesis
MSPPNAEPRADGRPHRPRVLVLNQYYWPGVEATGQLLSQLCSALADDFRVTVVTGMVPGAAAGRTSRDGVEIVRVQSTAFDRRRIMPRAVNYLTYLAASLVEGMRADPPDAVLCMTDPPVIADVALVVAKRFRAPLLVISQDVFPEIAVELKRLDNRMVIEVLRFAIRFYLERADRVVAIGETMRRRLEQKGAHPDRVVVIPNWVDTTELSPRPRDNPWAREHGLVGSFVVMHSGNIGHAQNLDALIRAGTFLRDLDDLRIILIGGGARRDELKELTKLLEVDAVHFFGYQPREVLSESLSSADVHVVGLAPGLAGYIVPSRLYGILAAGRPVIVAADEESETARVVREVGCGVVVPPGRPELLAEQIRLAHAGELELEAMGALGREFVTAEADRRVAVERYRRLLGEVVGDGAARR